MAKSGEEEFIRIETVLDRIEHEQAVLSVGEETIEIPKKLLPKKTKEGDVVWLTIATDEGERKQREKRAKELLNEILRGE